MDFLYPGEPEPARGAQLTRTESMLVSLGVHLLLLLLVVVLPRYFPEGLQEFFFGLPAPPPIAADPAAIAADSMATPDEPDPPEASVERIPLEFAYVKLPVEEAVAENEDAPLLSDRNRQARQQAPTPEDATNLTIDPHSEGSSIAREIPDSTIPEGIDTIEKGTRVVAGSGDAENETTAASGQEAGASEGEAGEARSPQDPVAIARALETDGGGPGPRLSPEEERPDTAGDSTMGPEDSSSAAEQRGEGEGAGDRGRTGDLYEPSDELLESFSDMIAGKSERKLVFSNPGYLREGDYAVMSFDTQEFPWGDYQRQVYLIIRENWYSRIPLSAREGLRGYACHRFVIAKSGAIVETRPVRRSVHPPFTKAALDAIHASDPLPPLPEAFRHETEGVTYCFFYNMHPAEAR